MTADWRTLCRGRDLTVDKDMIVVMLPGGRQQRISVSDNDDAYWLTSVVARPAVASTVANLPLRAWERNRATRLVAFKIDMRGRLKAESWVPKAGLTPAEFSTYLRIIAAEADRFEYQLTGADEE